MIFLLASLAFAFYVANFSNYNKTYGAIGGVIVLLLWLWILNMSLLFGAEFDAEMERGRQLQAGIEAEETIQLPPRDTKKSDKLQAREEEDIQRGRELRERSSATDGGGRPGYRAHPRHRSRATRGTKAPSPFRPLWVLLGQSTARRRTRLTGRTHDGTRRRAPPHHGGSGLRRVGGRAGGRPVGRGVCRRRKIQDQGGPCLGLAHVHQEARPGPGRGGQRAAALGRGDPRGGR